MTRNNFSIKSILLATLCLASLQTQADDLSSPSGKITLHADVVDGVPTYSITYKNKEVIRPSHLGFELADPPL